MALGGLTPGEDYLFQTYWIVKNSFSTRKMNIALEGDSLSNIAANPNFISRICANKRKKRKRQNNGYQLKISFHFISSFSKPQLSLNQLRVIRYWLNQRPPAELGV